MKLSRNCWLILLVALSRAITAFPDEQWLLELNKTLHEVPQEDVQKHRELFFFRDRAIKECIAREVLDFSDQFDPVAYRDMVLAEAGLTVEELIEAYKENKDTFQETPEHAAFMEAIEKRKAELEEVADIVEACQEEAEGGQSAVGAGAMVGARFAHAMEEPMNPVFMASQADSDTNAEQTAPAPTMKPTPYPTGDYSTSPTETPRLKFPIWLGAHMTVAPFFLPIFNLQFNVFLGGDVMACGALTTAPIGVDVGITVVVSLWPPNTGKHSGATMLGVEAGLLAPRVQYNTGYFSDAPFLCNGPLLSQFIIGAGVTVLPAAVELNGCQWGWDELNIPPR
jgi:hypothetical protein